MSEPIQHNANIRGKPLSSEDIQDFIRIDTADIESAKNWFDDTASIEWIGALDSKPIGDNGS